MLVLGLQGSPRKKGNTEILLSAFLEEAAANGARTHPIRVAAKKLLPCQECGTCERKGFCPLDDEMQGIYPLLWEADVIVAATPIFFYGATAQLKALIDRSQALWARRYTLGLTDPGRKWRKGLLLAVGATKGKNLFEGTSMTAQYFFDAMGARFEGTLGYRKVEAAGDIQHHPTALNEAREKVRELVSPGLARKKVLFVCTENACRSQMAGAFAQFHGGDRVEASSAGSAPADEVNPLMKDVMAEKGIDMAYRRPQTLEEATGKGPPDQILLMGCGDQRPLFPGVPTEDWDIEDPADQSIDVMRRVRDEIEERVIGLLDK
ncbi:MAG: NAD(P)H-dependent oxidoreductase [Deltaproteobacteria bacterium]|nr:NAD(P)H-dependent oxidoreductase [Deltaproteobacteria bacterium]